MRLVGAMLTGSGWTAGFNRVVRTGRNIESFWAILKRGVYGIYHHVSAKYLQQYVNEFSFRYNNRNADIFNVLMAQTVGA